MGLCLEHGTIALVIIEAPSAIGVSRVRRSKVADRIALLITPFAVLLSFLIPILAPPSRMLEVS